MTDGRGAGGEPAATIVVASGPTYEAAAGALDLAAGRVPVVILPASLRRDDPLAAAVRDALRHLGTSASLRLPANPAAALLGRGGHGWTSLAIRPPDAPAATMRLPTRLADAGAIWTVTDVDAVAGSGPYVLDLVARYAAPGAWLRRRPGRHRGDVRVDVNLACRPACCLAGKATGGGVVVSVTDDPVAAELFALALADEALPADRTVSGPWEDRVVQRATELELGVQIPRQIQARLVTPVDEDVRTVLDRVLARIGVSIP